MKYLDVLHQYWGYPDFRGIQRDIIESIGSGRDTLGLMPTGGGKSLTFQVPALAMGGVCIVVTPLISLMKDQVDHLRAKGIPATAIYSGMRHEEIVTALDNCIYGGVRLLYVSPERLSSDLFQIKVQRMDVSFITVDEAHCISQWGYDFRPSYLQIANLRKLVPDAPVLALTATATEEVVDDIQTQLAFRKKNVFRMSFARANLYYIVREAEDKEAELVHILSSTHGPAIVYARSRKRTKDVARLLCNHGLSATFYHAGLEPAEKDQRQDEWQQDKTRIMVATNAFGMGIDKADVSLVVHFDPPSSIEAYFQEAGRAGRNGERAYAVMLYNGHDAAKMKKRITDTFPEKELVQQVYEQLAYFFEVGVGSGAGLTREFGIEKFCAVFHHFAVQVDAALQILQRAGYILYDPNPDSRARVRFLLGREDLYRLNESSPKEAAVIDSLLRNYGGVFVDYVYVDDSFVAMEAGVERSEAYEILRSLTKRRIIDFIPRRNVPLITYTRDRVDGEDVVLTREVYEDRKESFERRISAMLAYCTNSTVCRSRQLLYYFGERQSEDCGHCDICLSRQSEVGKHTLNEAKKLIKQLLSDGQPHHITQLRTLPMNEDVLTSALQYMLYEEEVWMEGSNMRAE